jgi:hypothetical protein
MLRQSAHMAAGLSALSTDRALLIRNIIFAAGTHFCHRLSKSQGLVPRAGLGKMEKIHSSHRV